MEDVSNMNLNTQLIPVSAPANAAASAAHAMDDGTNSPKRKVSKVNNGKPRFVPFHVDQAPRITYAGAASNAAPTKPPPVATADPSPVEKPSICTQFLITGESMLRPSHGAAAPAADPSKIPPILGVLIKSVLTYDKKWKHYAMFNCTEYEVVAAKDQPFPESLLLILEE